MKLEFLDKFSKNSYIKFHKNPSSWNRVVPCGQTDRHCEADGLFRSFAKEPKDDLCAFIVLWYCEKVKHFGGSFVSDVIL